jgi:pSer/pThr/pTyr-binding forkhead associated (FHA) protein
METIGLSWVNPSTGAHHHQQFALPVRIGRNETNDLVLHDSRVSRRHAEIHLYDGQVIITDLHSMNGIYIDTQRVEQALLDDGIIIQIGVTQLAVVLDLPHEAGLPATSAPNTLTLPVRRSPLSDPTGADSPLPGAPRTTDPARTSQLTTPYQSNDAAQPPPAAPHTADIAHTSKSTKPADR